MRIWQDVKTTKKPKYVQTNYGKKRLPTVYEMGLIYPKNRWSQKIYSKDELGRNTEIKLHDEKLRIKELIPFWMEELVYDYDQKKRIRYDEMMDYILSVTEIAQIFTLNNKLFIQNEDNIKMFGNKNLSDCDRLFDIVKSDLIKKKKNNFIFVKDISTHQRVLLYDLLESKGYNRGFLTKHYSY